MRRLLCFLFLNSCLLSTTASADFATDSSWMYQSIDRSVNDAYRRNNDAIINNNNSYSNSGSGSSSTVKKYVPKYSAIAFSNKSANSGWAIHYPSKDEAFTAALTSCKASDCVIATWVKDGCMMLAVGDNDFAGARDEDILRRIEEGDEVSLPYDVITECSKRTQNCKITHRFCNGSSEVTYNAKNMRKPTNTDDLTKIRLSSASWLGFSIKERIERVKQFERETQEYLKTSYRVLSDGRGMFSLIYRKHPNSPLSGTGIISFISNQQGKIIAWGGIWNDQNICLTPNHEGICTK